MTSLTPETMQSALAQLQQINASIARYYPGDSPARQPIHTVYGGAQIFKSDTARKLGAVALKSLEDYAPTPTSFAKALKLGGSAALHKILYKRIVEKLRREPVEDFRIDFEDGYGNRPDSEEDEHAASVAAEIARGMADGTLSPFIGIRIKPFTEDLKARSIRTLDMVVSSLVNHTGGRLPDNFVVTLPKVIAPEHVTALVRLLEELEQRLSLPERSLKLEIMVETPQSIINSRGECALPALTLAGAGRCIAAHFGVYDYTASLNITATNQTMDHPACDFARHMMKVSLAGTGIWISDGATNVLPVGPHRAEQGRKLNPKQLRENRETVHRAWRLDHSHIAHSLLHGYYQGWDLHPAQLPIRYATVYKFFLEGFDSASIRLKTFIEKAAQATLIGDVFDDAATGQGLLNYFLRGLNCGAIAEEETKATGLTIDEIRARSFLKILQGRRK